MFTPLSVSKKINAAKGAPYYAGDKIPDEELFHGIPAIKVATHSFEDLNKLALEGIYYHWGRNKIPKEGKDVKIKNKPYEVYVRARRGVWKKRPLACY